MLKNLKKAAAIVLSFAMAVQFGLADSYYVNAVEEPVEPQQEETTTTTPQEQEEAPTTEEAAPQQQEEEDAQPVADEEPQPAAEEAQPQPQPVEQAEVKVSYVKEDGTDLMESVTATYDVGYRLDQDTNVFKEAHEAFEFEYAFVNGNKENKITKDQVKTSGLTVTSDMTSLTLVYKSTATQKDSKDKKVETANLSGEKEDDSDSDSEEKNISVASNTDTTRTIRVGDTITLTSRDVDTYNYYDHNWTVADGSKVKLNKTNGVSITVTGLQEGTTTVTDTYSSTWGWGETATKEYTITVNAPVVPTSISISGADTVKQFQTTQLTANFTPADANGKVTWTSSNEEILSVNENGLVTGNRQGSATITASVQGANNKTLSATKTIEVVKNESPSSGNKREALVYYLKDPTKDANSNGSDQWGPSSLGTAIVNVEGATWTGDKNCFDNVDQRVVSWPNGTNVIPRSNNAWDLIFDAYKASIERQLGVTIAKDDVEEITLVPAKISRNNGTSPDMHLDCNVNIKCKSVALVKYWLFDANGTKYDLLGSKSYLVKDESTTQPSDVTSKKFPTTKTVNGVTYTFSGWYTDQSLTTPAPSFPAKVTGSVEYYAKYVAGYQVTYNLAGGKFSNGSTSATEKHNVDTTVVVKEAPTRKGYKFTGWTVEGLDGTTTINSGESFTMPNGNVTITAQWEKKDINDYVTLTTKDVTETYNGQSHAAGEATAVAKAGKENEIGKLTVEYQKADGKWTTNREEITAKDVSDSKTVNVRVSSDDCVDYVTGTEKLTINPAEVTVTITGNTKTDTYDGTEKSVTGYTSEKTNKLYTDADFGLKADAKAKAKGTNAGTYQMGLTKDSFENKNANFAVTFKVTDGWLKIDQNEAEVTVTITGNKKTEPYTGTEKTVEGYTTEVKGANDSEVNVALKADAKAEAKGTNAGTYQMGLTKDSFTVTSNNYKNIKVVVKDGSLTINPAEVTVTITGNTKTDTYDGTEKSVTGYTSEKTNKLYTDADFGLKADAKAKAKGTNAGTYQMGLTKDSFENKNANFAVTFKVTDGWLKIDKNEAEVTVTITGNKKTEPYTGTEKTVEGYTTEVKGANDSEVNVALKADAKAEAKGTNAGTYQMGLTKDSFTVTSNNYKNIKVVVKDGSLTINPAAVTVTITGNTKTDTYDGTEKSVTGYTATKSNNLYTDADFGLKANAKAEAKGTNADTYKMGLTKDSFKNKNANFAVTFEVTDGWLKIDKNEAKVTVTIKGNKKTETYTGTEKSVTGYTTEVKGANDSEVNVTLKADAKAEAKGTDAKTYMMGLTKDSFKVTSNNYKNINVVVEDGSLTINPAAVTVTITGNTKTDTYDGTEKSVTGYTATKSNNLYTDADFGLKANAKAEAKGTNADTYKMGLTKDSFKNKNANFAVTFEVTDGWLKIDKNEAKVTVTIKGNKKTETYTGTEKSVTGYTTEVKGANDSEVNVTLKADAKAEAKGTDAKTYMMGLTKDSFKVTSNNYKNINVVVEDGSLTINPAAVTVTITGNTKTDTYDGTEKSVTGYTATKSNNLYTDADFGLKANAKAEAKGTNADTYKMGLTKDSFKNKNANFAVTFEVTDGWLKIDKNEAKVTVTIKGNKKTETYTGTEKSVTGYTTEVKGANDSEVNVTLKADAKAEAKGTDAKTYMMGLTKDSFKVTSNNYKNINVVVEDGSLTINPAAVTVTITGNTKTDTYDGTEKSVTGYTATKSNNLYTDADFGLKANAKAEAKGTNADTYKMGLTKDSFKNKNANFAVTFEVTDGWLKIDKNEAKVTVTIKGNKKTETYTGTEKSVTGYTTEVKGANDSEVNVTLKADAKAEAKGTDAKTYMMGLTKDSFKVTSNNYKNINVVVEDGSLTINPAAVTVTITGNTKTDTYDGTEKSVTGYTATKSNNLYTDADFGLKANAKAEAKGTNADTYKMGLTKDSFKNKNANFAVTFEVTDGWLKIDKNEAKVTVTIKGNKKTETYTGTEKSVTGYTTEVKGANDSEVNVTLKADAKAEAKGTNAGTYQMGLTKDSFTVTSNNYKNIKVVVKDGSLTINPAEVTVTITGNTKTDTYDGTEKSVTGYTSEKTNKLYTDADFGLKADAKAKAKGTNAGTYQMGLTKDSFENKNANFAVTFKVTDGWLKIDQNEAEVTVTITGNKKTEPYTGTEKTVEGYTTEVKGANDSEVNVALKADAKAEAKGTNAGTYQMGLTKDSFTVTSNNYKNIKVVVKDGSLTINPAEVTVTITGNTKTDTYDGTEKSVTGYTSEKTNKLYTDADFGLKADAKAKAKGTNAGTYQMGLTKDSFENKNANFAVTFKVTDGWLKIDQNEAEVTVTITGNKKTEPYTGTEKTVEGYTTEVKGANDSEVNVALKADAKAEAKGTNAGTYQMGLTKDSFTVTSNNYKNIKVVVKDGSLTINPAEVTVTITGNTKTDTYDGTEKSVTGYTSEKTNKLYTDADFGLKADAKAKAKGTNAGTYQMGLTKDSFENKNANFAVTFKVTDGWLKIDQNEAEVTVTITGNKKTEPYTGTEKTVEGYTTEVKGANDSEVNVALKADAKAEAKGTNAGTYQMGLTKDSFTVTSNNYKNIKVVVKDGSLTINPAAVTVTITGNTKTDTYDGTEKSVTGYTATKSNNLYTDADFGLKANAKAEAKGTNADTYKMGLTKDSFKNKNANFAVTFEVTDGWLKIDKKSIIPDGPKTPEEKKTGIKVTAPKDTTYSGNEQKREPVIEDTKTGKTLDKDDYSLSYSDDVTNAGTVTITVTGKGNYTGKFEVTYKINPCKVTLKSETASKPYDGTALTKPAVTVSGDGFVKGEVSDIKATGSVTTVSEGEVTNTITFTKENNYKAGNYTIVKDEGKLSIRAQSIDPGTDPEKPNPDYTGAKVNSPSDEVYDGNEHMWSPTVTDKADKKLKAGTDYTVEYSTSDFTNVGTIEVVITGIGNYSGTVKRSYKVTPKEYTVTTESATKTYSGTALTAGGKVEGIVSGETVEFTTTGSQTEVGTSKNTYELVWKSAKATNYTLAKESIGELTVKAKSIVPDDKDTPDEKKTGITVSEPSDSKYDGKEHKEVLTVTDTKTGKELVAGTDYSVTYSADLVHAGTVTIKVAGLGNYTGSFTKTYKITKRTVTLTSATVSKVYDGSALTNTDITVSGDGFVEGEGASYEVTGSQTEVGNSANAFEYKLNEKTLASNYNITKVVGTLTITAAPAPVTPATPSTPSTPSTTPRTPSAPQVTTPVETVEKETTPKAEPKKEEKVEEEYTPKASPQYYWALINLICAILTVLFGLLLLISKRHKSEDDDEEDDDETKQQTNDDNEDKEQEKKRGLFTRVLAVLIAIVSVVFFLVTEDLSLPWTWTDQWTIWMVVIGLVQIVVFFVGRKWKNVDDDEDEEEAQQA